MSRPMEVPNSRIYVLLPFRWTRAPNQMYYFQGLQAKRE
jgi:hypothetical protein